MTRREWLACTAAAGLLHAAPTAPTAPVSIAKCSSYDGDLAATLFAVHPLRVALTRAPGVRGEARAGEAVDRGPPAQRAGQQVGVAVLRVGQAVPAGVGVAEEGHPRAGPVCPAVVCGTLAD